MRHIYTLILIILSLLTGINDHAFAQENSFETDFSGSDNGNWFGNDENLGEFTFEYENEELKVTYEKTSWHFFGIWVKPFDIVPFPYIKFDIKAEAAGNVKLKIKDDGGSQIEKDISMTTEWKTVYYDLSSDLSLLTTTLNEIQFDVGFGDASGVIYIDNFKLGGAAAPPAGLLGTGVTIDFSENQVDTLFTTNPEYDLSIMDETLEVNVSKQTKWRSFSMDLGDGIYDISSNPFVNLKIKTDQAMVLYLYLEDNNGNNEFSTARIYPKNEFVNYNFDFSDSENIDLVQIKSMIFSVNGNTISYDGLFYADDLKLGTDAVNFASIGVIQDKEYYINSGSHDILVTDLKNVSLLAVSGGETLIENVQVGEITEGYAHVSFDIIEDAVGMEEIVLTATGSGDVADHSRSFSITVTENLAPTIDKPENRQAITGEEQTVHLTGITDGDASIEQEIEITAWSTDTSIIGNDIMVSYEQGSRYGSLSYTPKKMGTDTIKVTVKDDGGGTTDSTIVMYEVHAYESLNMPPVIDSVEQQNLFFDKGEQIIELTGIGDGDDGGQNITITAESLDTNIVLNPVIVEYDNGSTARLKVTPNPENTGKTMIAVNLIDDGGTPGNDGNDSTALMIAVETLKEPAYGYVADLSDLENDIAAGIWGFPGTYSFTSVDSGDFHAIRVDCNDKFYWDGFNLVFSADGIEMDLTDNPYLSMEIYPLDDATLHWIWFYDSDGYRNNKYNRDKRKWAQPGKWNHIYFDFSGPEDMYNADENELNNQPINTSRIVRVLFDMHNAEFGWPPPENYNGSFLIRNVKVGSEAVLPETTPVCTIDPVGDKVYFAGAGEQTIKLTGISNGNDGGASVIAISNNNTFIPDPVSSDVNDNGEATISFDPGEAPGRTEIKLIVNASGSQAQETTFDIEVVSDEITEMANVDIDLTTEYQTIRGFGTFYDYRYPDIYTKQLNASAVRIGLIGNQIETENDNNDPYVLNREGLNYDAFNWDYFRQLKEGGVETFILTSWSPPAWMKRNLSVNFGEAQAVAWENTVNILEPYYYEEFAESMVAVITMFKEESGVDIDAIGIQNEPAFNEPYGSAILSPQKFAELLVVVGKRFEQEGIDTKLYMPEQVFSQSFYSMAEYIDSLQANNEAYQYTDIIATHGYAADGIQSGAPNFSQWTTMWDNAQEGEQPKELWMTETHRGFTSWDDAMYIAQAIHGSLAYGNIGLWTQWSIEGQHLTKGKPNDMFYACKNYFAFVRPGMIRVESISNDEKLMVTAFKNNEGKLVIVAINNDAEPKAFSLSGNDLPEKYAAYLTAPDVNLEPQKAILDKKVVIPANSIITLVARNEFNPTINQIADKNMILSEGTQSINLTGISDGGEGNQNIQIMASSSDTTVAKASEIVYSTPDATATLNITPLKVGTTQITVEVTDDGTQNNNTRRLFNISVVTSINNKPTVEGDNYIEILEDEEGSTVTLTNITDGDDGTQELSIDVNSTNTDIIPHPVVSDLTDGQLDIQIAPNNNVSGEAIVIVSITDDGGTTDNNGNQTVQKAIVVNVAPVNDKPTIRTVEDIPVLTVGERRKRAKVAGITDGDPELEQELTVTAESADESVALVESVSYRGDTIAYVYLEPGTVAGQVDITVTVQDNGGTQNGGEDTETFTFSVVVEPDVDNITEITNGKLQLFPNPVHDELIIITENIRIDEIMISNVQGSIIKTISSKNSKGMIRLNVRDLKAGMYVVTGKNEQGFFRNLFIKK